MKFSIRDLLLMTLIVALAVGWWVDHRIMGAKISDLLEAKEFSEWKIEQLADWYEQNTGRKVANDENGIGLIQEVPTSSPTAPNPYKD